MRPPHRPRELVVDAGRAASRRRSRRPRTSSSAEALTNVAPLRRRRARSRSRRRARRSTAAGRGRVTTAAGGADPAAGIGPARPGRPPRSRSTALRCDRHQPAGRGPIVRVEHPMRVVIADDSGPPARGRGPAARRRPASTVVAQAGDAEDLAAQGARSQARCRRSSTSGCRPTQSTTDCGPALTIREELPDVGILLLSQYVEESLRAGELLATGAEGVGYLLKDRVARGQAASSTRSSAWPTRLGTRSRRSSRGCSDARATRDPWML